MLLWRWFSPSCCGTCRYWQEGIGDSAQERAHGTCRAELPRVVTYSAPQPVVLHGKAAPAQVNVQSYWPPVTPAEWCGKFRRRWR
jgi:hypothetical protein